MRARARCRMDMRISECVAALPCAFTHATVARAHWLRISECALETHLRMRARRFAVLSDLTTGILGSLASVLALVTLA